MGQHLVKSLAGEALDIRASPFLFDNWLNKFAVSFGSFAISGKESSYALRFRTTRATCMGRPFVWL